MLFMTEIESTVFDFEELLAPISEEFPCGEADDLADSIDTQLGTKYEQMMKEFRDGLSSESEQDLASFIEQIEDCFRQNCKSVTLAFRLPVLLFLRDGLEGFRDGLNFIYQLYDRYAETIHPPAENLKNVIRNGIFDGGDDSATHQYRLFLFTAVAADESASPYFKIRNAKFKSPDTEVVGQFATLAAATKPEFYDALVGVLDDILKLFNGINQLFAGKLNDTSVSIVNYHFYESVERMRNVIHNLGDEHCIGYPIQPETPEPEAEGGEPTAAAAGGEQPVATGPVVPAQITTREQAIEILQKAAEYFAKTEPHSPVSYSLQETISWTKMSLPDLWKKLLEDEDQLEQLAKRVGFKFGEPSSEE